MAFFGGDPFGNDPFFGDMHQHMHRQMRDMDRMMSAMIGGPFGFGGGFDSLLMNNGNMRNARQMMIDDGRRYRQNAPTNQHRNTDLVQHNRDPFAMTPFGGGGLLGGGLFGGLMRHMDDLQNRAVNDPNSHVYSHSTVISYDGTGEQPRIYEASNSIRKAGDVKETRRTVRDSATGEDKISIGHAIGEREHVIEKKRDRDGRIREKQRFVNLDQEMAQNFDREFIDRAQRNMATSGRNNRSNRRAIVDNDTNTATVSTPIVTLDDDDDEPTMRTTENNNRRDGPIIREVSDDEAERITSSKRRRGGVIGKFFHG